MHVKHLWVLSESLPFAAGQSQTAPREASQRVISQQHTYL